MTDYSHMDIWSDEEVARFKEEAIEQQELFGDEVILKKSAFPKRNQLVAEGDSWFDYRPGIDLIDCLRKYHGYSIKNYAEAGDTLENMIFGTKYDKGSFQPTEPKIFQVLRKIEQIKPKVFLFSGGGNDVAGKEFASFLNHANTGMQTLRRDYAEYMTKTYYKKCCQDLIDKVLNVSDQTHIIMHGYAHTFPTGRGVSFLGFNFSGPWLRPALTSKNIINLSDQYESVEIMINLYNEMLIELSQVNQNFHYVDLRPIIDPKKDWANELHLKNSAYARAAEKINDVIEKIFHQLN